MTIDRVGGGALVLLALFTLWESRKLPLGTLQNPGPSYVPVLLALLLLGFGLVVIAMGRGSDGVTSVGWGEWRHAIAILGCLAFMALALERLGYRITIFVALAFLLGVVERRSVVTTTVFAVAFSGLSFYLFATVLRVQLPRSPWGF
ncbi:MAG TPA: tripartite tricarboxylate transporter TctB family protein [Terriglobales bacterium]|nr:tripartite tricarboxylate transporter TctB family protein [Terriglobales bacterium]